MPLHLVTLHKISSAILSFFFENGVLFIFFIGSIVAYTPALLNV